MPIRHCEKCGLKVLIDESQASVSPFYCQRCTASLKSEEAQKGSPPSASARSEAARAGTKPGMVRVQCPYCKATFNGRIPQRPARGACPICQKELILLPTGEIRPAAGFDPIRWQREQAAKKKAEEPPPAPEPAPPAEAPAPAEPQMPSWMDEAAPSAGTAPAPAEAAPAATPEPPSEEVPLPEAAAADILREAVSESPPPAPSQAPAEAPSEPPAPAESPEPAAPEAGPPSAAEAPGAEAPPPPPSPAAAPRKPALPHARGTARRGPLPERPLPARTGSGLIVLAFLLLLLPVVAGPILYGNRQSLKKLAEPMGERFSRGFRELYRLLRPPPPWKPSSEVPAPEKTPAANASEEKPKPGPEERKRDEEEIVRLWTEYMREKRTLEQKGVGATEAEKEGLQKAQEELQKKLKAVEALKTRYRETYGTSFEPREQP